MLKIVRNKDYIIILKTRFYFLIFILYYIYYLDIFILFLNYFTILLKQALLRELVLGKYRGYYKGNLNIIR